MGMVAAIGVGLSAGSAIGGGIQARRMGDYQHKLADQAAGQQEASSQRAAMDEQHRSKLLQSRAQAVAAASGGGASDPGVIKIISNIAGEGAYRSEVALYQGEERARDLRTRGEIAQTEGDQRQTAGYIKGIGTILSQGSSMYTKYGQGGYSSLGYGTSDPTMAGAGMTGGDAFPY